MMKALTYIFALVILALSLNPKSELLSMGAEDDAQCCANTVCHPSAEREPSDEDQPQERDAADGVCNPFQFCGPCYFLFYVGISSYSYEIPQIKFSSEYLLMPQSLMPSQYISAFWHLPRHI